MRSDLCIVAAEAGAEVGAEEDLGSLQALVDTLLQGRALDTLAAGHTQRSSHMAEEVHRVILDDPGTKTL